MIDYAKIFSDSNQRVLAKTTSKEEEFFDVFYDRFIASSPLVLEKFKNVDMGSQKRMLKQSLAYLLNLFVMKKIPDHLVSIAQQHDRDHADIPPELYGLWLECLVDTVKEFDPQFDDDVELAWRLVCSQVIALMTFVYKKSVIATPA